MKASKLAKRVMAWAILPILEDLRREEEARKNRVPIFVLPGGKTPIRSTDGAIGFDAFIRAIVSPVEMDPVNPQLRKNLFDFHQRPADPEINRHVIEQEGKLFYRMDPQETVTVGLGFLTAMEFPMFYWVAPRSGLASRWGITVTNAPGTIDPDYRGEAGMLIYNRNNHTFDLSFQMKIVQLIFQRAIIPELVPVYSAEELPATLRGAGGFGSTGLH